MEGNAGTSLFVFTITKTGDNGLQSSVTVNTSDGTATVADNDYVPITGQVVVFPSGTFTRPVNVTVVGDMNIEPDEIFFVNLSAPTNGTVSVSQGVGTVLGDKGGGSLGFEGDIAPRPSGDGAMNSTDVIQTRRFAAGLDTPNPATNELQRADSAPRATLGDNLINSGDVVQARRYAASLDPLTSSGGPTVPPFGEEELAAIIGGAFMSGDARGPVLRLTSQNGRVGSDVTVGVTLDRSGAQVAAAGFTLVYDPAKLSSPVVRLSAKAPSGIVLTVNDKEPGRLTILVDSVDAITLSELVSITFTVADDVSGTSPIAFDQRSISVAGLFGDTIEMSGIETNVRINGRPRR